MSGCLQFNKMLIIACVAQALFITCGQRKGITWRQPSLPSKLEYQLCCKGINQANLLAEQRKFFPDGYPGQQDQMVPRL